jgi:hypothetical protein
MSIAKKCDVCHRLYEESHPDKNVDDEKKYYIELNVCISVYTGWLREGKGLDVCDECISKLLKKYLKI